MAKSYGLNFPFPIKGFDEFWSNRSQPILTSPNLLNVRAHDSIEGRNRGGQRCGIQKIYNERLGGEGNRTIRMLTKVSSNKAASTYSGVDEDNFNRADSYSLGGGWSQMSGYDYGLRIFGDVCVDAGVGRKAANVRKALSLDSDNPYTISIDIYPHLLSGWVVCRKYLFARMDDDAPDPFDECTYVWMEITPPAVQYKIPIHGFIVSRMAGAEYSKTEFNAWFYEWESKITLTLAVSGNTVQALLGIKSLAQHTAPAQAGYRVGLGSYQMHILGGNTMDNWRVTGVEVEGELTARKTELVVSAGANVYAERTPGFLTLLSGEGATLSSNHPISAAELDGKLYIADYATTERASPSVSPGDYGPKVYDPSTGLITPWTADVGKGGVPVGCPLICAYRGRIVLAKDGDWYMSRVADADDWDYDQTDIAAAQSGPASEAGQPGERITALVPFSDDYLILASRRRLRVLRGDPAEGGRLDVVSHDVGILARKAWCYDPSGGIYFMADDGLYYYAVGGQPKPLSQDQLPETLSGVNLEVYDVLLEYDLTQNGVFIFLTSRTTGSCRHFFYDIATEGFFPDMYPDDQGPVAVFNYESDMKTYRKMILGGRDGYLRTFEEKATDDDGTAINSFVSFAPQRIAKSDLQEGIIQSVQATMAWGSKCVNYEIRVHDNHEYAWRAVARVTGEWRGGGMLMPIRERIRGGSVSLYLYNNTTRETWATEKVVAYAKSAGRMRAPSDIPLVELWELPTPSPSIEPSPEPGCTSCDQGGCSNCDEGVCRNCDEGACAACDDGGCSSCDEGPCTVCDEGNCANCDEGPCTVCDDGVCTGCDQGGDCSVCDDPPPTQSPSVTPTPTPDLDPAKFYCLYAHVYKYAEQCANEVSEWFTVTVCMAGEAAQTAIDTPCTGGLCGYVRYELVPGYVGPWDTLEECQAGCLGHGWWCMAQDLYASTDCSGGLVASFGECMQETAVRTWIEAGCPCVQMIPEGSFKYRMVNGPHTSLSGCEASCEYNQPF